MIPALSSTPCRAPGPGLLAVTLLALTGACEEKIPDPCPRFEAAPRPAKAAGDPVVAEVNGRPILASQVVQAARETGRSPREALQTLLDEELLVQEAERRGLARDPEVIEAAKRVAVYRLLRSGFERQFTAASLPEADLKKLYKLNERPHFRHPELRRYSHLFAQRPLVRAGRKLVLRRALDARLHAFFERLRAAVVAGAPKTWKEFEALRDQVKEPDFPVYAERGTSAAVEIQKPFAEALFALGKPGDVSGVVTTAKSVHLIFLVGIVPEKHIPYEKARDEILARHWPEARREAFQALVKDARKRCRIRVSPEHLPVGPEGTPDPSEREPRR